jgi:superfamily II DNA/RNA helicase
MQCNVHGYFCSHVQHGEMSQAERESAMNPFRFGDARVLVTTDVLARRTYTEQISLVINFDHPSSVEHVLGRLDHGGRYGRKGVVLNFVDRKDAA